MHRFGQDCGFLIYFPLLTVYFSDAFYGVYPLFIRAYKFQLLGKCRYHFLDWSNLGRELQKWQKPGLGGLSTPLPRPGSFPSPAVPCSQSRPGHLDEYPSRRLSSMPVRRGQEEEEERR